MITNILRKIQTDYNKSERRIKKIKSEIAGLIKQGTSSGKIYIRKDKSKKTGEELETTYIIYPMNKGKRRKEYIGRDEFQIEHAKARIERYHAMEKLRAELEVLEVRQAEIFEGLKGII
jgi:hypothetical protein